jgi:hypothetical protein
MNQYTIFTLSILIIKLYTSPGSNKTEWDVNFMTISLTDRTREREREKRLSFVFIDWLQGKYTSLIMLPLYSLRLVEKGPQSSIENDIESTFSPRSVQNFSVVFKFLFVIKLFSDFLQRSNIYNYEETILKVVLSIAL